MHSQIFNVEDKKNNNISTSGDYYRFFPMSGIFMETPMINRKNNFYVTQKVSLIINSAQSNSNKLSLINNLNCSLFS